VGSPIECPNCGKEFEVPAVGVGAHREKPPKRMRRKPSDIPSSASAARAGEPATDASREESTDAFRRMAESLSEERGGFEYADEAPTPRQVPVEAGEIPQVWEGGPPTEEDRAKALRRKKTVVIDIRRVGIFTIAAAVAVFGVYGIARNFIIKPTYIGDVYIFGSTGEKVYLSGATVYYIPDTDEAGPRVRNYERELGGPYYSIARRHEPAAEGGSVFAVADQLSKYVGEREAAGGTIALAYHGAQGIAEGIEKQCATASAVTGDDGKFRLERLPNDDGYLWCRVKTDKYFLHWIHPVHRGLAPERQVKLSPNNAKFVLLLSETRFFQKKSTSPTAGGGMGVPFPGVGF